MPQQHNSDRTAPVAFCEGRPLAPLISEDETRALVEAIDAHAGLRGETVPRHWVEVGIRNGYLYGWHAGYRAASGTEARRAETLQDGSVQAPDGEAGTHIICGSGLGRTANDGPLAMKVGDKVSIDGQMWTCTWTSADMTDEERYQSHLRTAEFMESYGLSGAFQRMMAERYRTNPSVSS